jgi:hypothetical protein
VSHESAVQQHSRPICALAHPHAGEAEHDARLIEQRHSALKNAQWDCPDEVNEVVSAGASIRTVHALA